MTLLAALSYALQETPALGPISTLGVGGGIAALVFYFYRADRKESQEALAALAKKVDERAAAIALDFRGIVQDNTRAITALTGKLDSQSESNHVIELLAEALKQQKKLNLEP